MHSHRQNVIIMSHCHIATEASVLISNFMFKDMQVHPSRALPENFSEGIKVISWNLEGSTTSHFGPAIVKKRIFAESEDHVPFHVADSVYRDICDIALNS